MQTHLYIVILLFFTQGNELTRTIIHSILSSPNHLKEFFAQLGDYLLIDNEQVSTEIEHVCVSWINEVIFL